MKKTLLLFSIAVLLIVGLAVIQAQDQDVKKVEKAAPTAVKQTGACTGCAAAAACKTAGATTPAHAETVQTTPVATKCSGCTVKPVSHTATAAAAATKCTGCTVKPVCHTATATAAVSKTGCPMHKESK